MDGKMNADFWIKTRNGFWYCVVEKKDRYNYIIDVYEAFKLSGKTVRQLIGQILFYLDDDFVNYRVLEGSENRVNFYIKRIMNKALSILGIIQNTPQTQQQNAQNQNQSQKRYFNKASDFKRGGVNA